MVWGDFADMAMTPKGSLLWHAILRLLGPLQAAKLSSNVLLLVNFSILDAKTLCLSVYISLHEAQTLPMFMGALKAHSGRSGRPAIVGI